MERGNIGYDPCEREGRESERLQGHGREEVWDHAWMGWDARAWGKARDKNAVWVVWDRVGSYGRE